MSTYKSSIHAEQQLKYERLKSKAYDKMIDIAEEELNIKIRKKSRWGTTGAGLAKPGTVQADWIVSRQDHWIFEGTGMRKIDKIPGPGLVGWEYHGDPADLPGLKVVAEGTMVNSRGLESHYTAKVYPGPKGNWIFNAFPKAVRDPIIQVRLKWSTTE